MSPPSPCATPRGRPPLCWHVPTDTPFAGTPLFLHPSLPAPPLCRQSPCQHLGPGTGGVCPRQPVCGGGGGSSPAGGTVPAPIHRGSSSAPCSPTCSAAATLRTAVSWPRPSRCSGTWWTSCPGSTRPPSSSSSRSPSHPSWRRRGGWGAPRGPCGGNMKCDFPHTREPEPAWAQLISFLSLMFVLGKIKARSPSALFKQSRSELAAAGAGGLLWGAEGSAWSSPLLCPPLLARVPLPCADGIRLRQRPQAPASHASTSLSASSSGRRGCMEFTHV